MPLKSFKDIYHSSPIELKEIIIKQWEAKQNSKYHPEGNTLKHIIIVTNRAIKEHPDCAIAYNNLAELYEIQELYDSSLFYFNLSLSIDSLNFSSVPPSIKH